MQRRSALCAILAPLIVGIGARALAEPLVPRYLIFFDPGTSNLVPAADGVIHIIVTNWRNRAGSRAVLRGHLANETVNHRLAADQRAANVMRALIAAGLPQVSVATSLTPIPLDHFSSAVPAEMVFEVSLEP